MKILIINILITFTFIGYSQIIVKDDQTLQTIRFSIKDSTGKALCKDEFACFIDTNLYNGKILIESEGYLPVSKSTTQIINTTIYLSDAFIELKEVVLSVNKSEESKDDLPRSIEVFTEKKIINSHANTSGDFLQSTGKVFVQKSQMGGGSPVIRGFEANKVLLMVDGIRMNNAIYRGGHLQNIITVDPFLLDRIEVTFGPGSVIYGSDALGGVISLYSPKGKYNTEKETQIGGKAIMRYQSVSNTKTSHIDFNIYNQKWSAVSSVSYQNFGDLKYGQNYINDEAKSKWSKNFQVKRFNDQDSMVAYNKNSQAPTGYEQIDLSQKLQYKTNNVEQIINVQYSQASDIPRTDNLSRTKNGLPIYSEWYYSPQSRLLAYYKLNIDSSIKTDKISLSVAYQNIKEGRNTRKFGSNQLENTNDELNIFSTNLDVFKKIKRHEFRVGGDLQYNLINSYGYTTNIITNVQTASITRYPDGGSETRNLAFYLTHSIEIIPHFFILSEGIRFTNNYLSSQFKNMDLYFYPFENIEQKNSSLNGFVGLTLNKIKNIKLYTNFSTGFRTPNVDDVGKIFENDPETLIIPNNQIKPEQVYSTEIGIEYSNKKNIKIETNAYYSIFDQIVNLQPTQLNNSDSLNYNGNHYKLYHLTNNNRGYIYGGNILAKLKLSHPLHLYTNLTYTYGKIVEKDTTLPLDHIPPIYGKTGIIYEKKKFRTELNALYNFKKDISLYNPYGEDNQKYALSTGTPTWCTINYQINYTINSNIQTSIFIENILDQNYRVFASGTNGPGRNISAMIKIVY